MALFTLCWDCAKAVGGCSWSDRLKPVKGWTLKKAEVCNKKNGSSYVVVECPEFVMDAYEFGTRRTPREIKLNH